MQSFYSNGRTNKPILRSVTIQANANVVVIEPSNSPTFDYWLRISTLDKGHPIRVPLKLYDRARETLKEGTLCLGVTLNRQDGEWYATLSDPFCDGYRDDRDQAPRPSRRAHRSRTC